MSGLTMLKDMVIECSFYFWNVVDSAFCGPLVFEFFTGEFLKGPETRCFLCLVFTRKTSFCVMPLETPSLISGLLVWNPSSTVAKYLSW